MEVDITDAVDTFREVLNCSWPPLARLSEGDATGSFLDDWMQANWEMVVEASIDTKLHAILEVYGNGADCNIKSSRVSRPEASPTTPVYIRYVGNEDLVNSIDGTSLSGIMTIDYFASLKDGWPVIENPFDHVVISEAESTVIPIRDLRYYIIV